MSNAECKFKQRPWRVCKSLGNGTRSKNIKIAVVIKVGFVLGRDCGSILSLKTIT